MARSFLGSCYYFIHRSIRPSESDIVCDRILEKINPLEYEAEVLHKRVKAVLSYISSAKRNFAFLSLFSAMLRLASRSG